MSNCETCFGSFAIQKAVSPDAQGYVPLGPLSRPMQSGWRTFWVPCPRCFPGWEDATQLRDQLDEAVGLIKDVLGSIEGSPNPTELWYEVRSQLGRYKQALNRLDAGEGSNDKA